MAEKAPNQTPGLPGVNMNKSNMARSVIFTFLVVCLVMLLVANFNSNKNTAKTEVAISDVIQRANDPNGNIEKITVTGNTLDITLKGKSEATETSRKYPSGTLYDQGLVNYCENLEVLDF